MRIVSNSSPLINLARIGQLSLLQLLFQEILVPEAVWNEVVLKGIGQPGAEEIKNSVWIKMQTISNKPLVMSLMQDLDAGEAEAITLCMETEADLLLMDERFGRETAQHLGLQCIGLIGLLLTAKKRGFIGEITPFLDALRSVAGFRIDDSLYQKVIHDAGEA